MKPFFYGRNDDIYCIKINPLRHQFSFDCAIVLESFLLRMVGSGNFKDASSRFIKYQIELKESSLRRCSHVSIDRAANA